MLVPIRGDGNQQRHQSSRAECGYENVNSSLHESILQGPFVEGLNVISGPNFNKVLNVITFCPKCNNNLP